MTTCTQCNELLDAHTGVGTDEHPAEGDLSVCFECGTISRFDDHGNLVPVTDEELRQLAIEFGQDHNFKVLFNLSAYIKAKRTT